ncbi:MAG: tetratricopeptide repeat protein [Acidobacteria bacterium]|nr:tetratricopeptide repeat protein [Acidobacteriota bacterium]
MIRSTLVTAALCGLAVLVLLGAQASRVNEERLAERRNLGKAFYENPATQQQAVEEFRKALDLAPDSARERLNFGLALLRAGRTAEAIGELEKAQKQDASIPHTWFNLGITFKREGQYERGVQQLEQMIRLRPEEPVAHYNLAVLLKLTGKPQPALKHLERARDLDPNLAGPHFQLYNAYRQAGRTQDAGRELKIFQEIKKRTEGAAVPEDMEWSFYSEIYEPIEPAIPDAAPGELSLAPRKLAEAVDGLALVDADADGAPDVLAWSAQGVRLFRRGLAPGTPLAGLKGAHSIAAGDFDNDGLPDLAVIMRGDATRGDAAGGSGSGAALFRNLRGRFVAAPGALPGGRYATAVWLDYDHDYDLDLFLLGEDSRLMRNQGQAGFAEQPFPFVAGRATDGVLFELVPDTDAMDLVVSYADRAGVLYRDRLAGNYEAAPLGALAAGAGRLTVFDFNNDGWMDLAARSTLITNRAGTLEASLAAGGTLPVFADLSNRGAADLVAGGVVYRNLGRGNFQPAGKAPEFVTGAAADLNLDGRQDLVGIGPDRALRVAVNRTLSKNRFARVALAGVKNLKRAAGAEVEVKTGTLYQKRLYPGYPIVFGLASKQVLDTVRITWPNGLIQNEPKQPAGKTLAIQEAPRLSGSCPMIFTWNGREFEFITDVLGVAPLGASAGDGKFFPVDHDEYVRIRGESLAAVDGRYQIRITEELREVAYLDQVKLIALDHPAGIDVFTNEKFQGPPFPEFRLYRVRERSYPTRARDDQGRDVLPRILQRDRTYPDGFARNHAGIASPHHLELEFEALPANPVLVLNGWVDWADGSTFRGASQESRDGLMLPYLQAERAGKWETVVADMGIPAGKPKTMVVDLAALARGDRKLRIATNLCVYWDEIFVAENLDSPVSLTPVATGSAELRFRGFSKPTIHPERKQPESFDYSQVRPASMWNPTPGLYTPYGDVLGLLDKVDDRLLIMGSGDELRLVFDGRALPPPNPGWRRDFLLYVDGWAKDGDANTAHSQTVEPLPFHAMSQYPYPPSERYPDRERHNTRPALKLVRPLR